MSATAVIDKAPPPRTAAERPVAAMSRNMAVDAYRGLVMLLMMGEVMQFWHVMEGVSRQRLLAHPRLSTRARRVGRHEPA